MNLGTQPTVDPNSPSAVEVHLLDQNLSLIDQELIIEPVKRLRGQEKFQDLTSLSNQIGKDAILARTFLERNNQNPEWDKYLVMWNSQIDALPARRLELINLSKIANSVQKFTVPN